MLHISLSVREQGGNEMKKGRNNPGGLVMNGSPTKEPSPTVPSLPLGLGKPLAVSEASPQISSSATNTAAVPYSSPPALESVFPGESRGMSSKVAPSSHVHSPVHRVHAPMTSSLATSSSKAVAPSVCISGPRLRTWWWTILFLASETFDATAIVMGVIFSSPLALSDRRELNSQWAESMSVILFWIHGNPSSRSYACIGTKSKYNSSTGAK